MRVCLLVVVCVLLFVASAHAQYPPVAQQCYNTYIWNPCQVSYQWQPCYGWVLVHGGYQVQRECWARPIQPYYQPYGSFGQPCYVQQW